MYGAERWVRVRKPALTRKNKAVVASPKGILSGISMAKPKRLKTKMKEP